MSKTNKESGTYVLIRISPEARVKLEKLRWSKTTTDQKPKLKDVASEFFNQAISQDSTI